MLKLREYVTSIYGKDSPWLNENIENATRMNAFQRYLKYGKTNINYANMQLSVAELTDAIHNSKNKYFKCRGGKLNNPSTLAKTWSIRFSFIPHLLVNDKLLQTS